jgi:hypothetical protein
MYERLLCIFSTSFGESPGYTKHFRKRMLALAQSEKHVLWPARTKTVTKKICHLVVSGHIYIELTISLSTIYEIVFQLS